MAKTIHSKMHRIRHRGRLQSVTNRQRVLIAHADEAASQMNAIGGVAGVSRSEVIDSIENDLSTVPAQPRDIRARMQLGLTTSGEVQALGIPIV